jgi:hypothetical protein
VSVSSAIGPSRRTITSRSKSPSAQIICGIFRQMQSERGRRLRSFLIGGLVGSLAGVAAAGRMRVKPRPGRRPTPAGLAAFEQAPCYQELVEREAAADER